MKLDWEIDVMRAAEAEVANLRGERVNRDELRADLLSVSWELVNSGREFDSVRHVLSVAKLRIKRRMHLDNGCQRSIDGRPMNGEERPKRHPDVSVRAVEAKQNSPIPESDGRFETWLATMTPRQAEVCRALLAGMTMWRIAHDWGISRQSVRITRERAAARLRKLGVA